MIIHEVICHLVFDFKTLALRWPIPGNCQVAGLKEARVHVLTWDNLGRPGPVVKLFTGFGFFSTQAEKSGTNKLQLCEDSWQKPS